MDEIAVEIVRLVDDDRWPAIVAAELADASGRRHTFVDKLPIFSSADDLPASYPQPGVIRCTVLARWNDPQQGALARIDTGRPDGVESTEKATEFVVRADQIGRR